VADGALDEPTAREDQRPERDEHVAEREATAAGSAEAPEPDRRPERAADEHDRTEAAPDAGQRTRQGVEVVLADRQGVGRDRAVDRCRQHDAGREPAEEQEHRAHRVAGPAVREQVDGAEREPRHVHDRPEQVEDPERPFVPAGRRPRREGRRGQGEQHEGDGPGALVWRPRPRPADGGGLREHGRDGSGDESETGDHERI